MKKYPDPWEPHPNKNIEGLLQKYLKHQKKYYDDWRHIEVSNFQEDCIVLYDVKNKSYIYDMNDYTNPRKFPVEVELFSRLKKLVLADKRLRKLNGQI